MELIKDTPLEVAWQVWQALPPKPSLTVVVKGTFTLVPEGVSPLAEVQAFPTGDAYVDDDVERSLRYASDLEPLKPHGECMVVGSFHAPGGHPVTQSKAAFQIGPVGKQVAVFGDRAWDRGRASTPTAIGTLPLSWERAFGGPGLGANPVGRGLAQVQLDGGSRVLLPNIEDPRRLIAARDQRPTPVGFGPIPRTWESRMRFAGTYDARWQRTRYPFLAEDLDWRFFNAAPVDQQIDGYWRGDEEITLRHLHPEHPLIRCSLPGLRAHAFLVRRGSEQLHDVGLALDTITVDADEGVAYCVWRGVKDVGKEDLTDILHLYVAHDAPAERQGVAGFTARYRVKLDELARERIAADPEQAPSSSVVRHQGFVAALIDPSAVGARWAHLDQANTLREQDGQALGEAMRALFESRRAPSNALRPVFEDALGLEAAGPPTSSAEEHAPSAEEQLELEMQLALGALLDQKEEPQRVEVRAALAAGDSLAGRDLAGADLSNLEFSETDLRGAILARANLSGSRFGRVRFDGANLGEAELSLATFEGCSFIEADLTSVRAHRVRMYECDLTGATLSVSLLREARFSACRLVRSDLRESDVGSADFRDCTLDEADLSACVLEDAVFRGCSLVDAWLEGGVRARGVSFDGCTARLLRASEAGDFEGASFRMTVLDGARFGGARLHKANFSLAQLSRADFSGALLTEALLVGCDLRMTRFDRAVLVKASMMKSNLMEARFEGANLRFADLRGANLFAAELWQAKLEDARLDLADLTGTRIG